MVRRMDVHTLFSALRRLPKTCVSSFCHEYQWDILALMRARVHQSQSAEHIMFEFQCQASTAVVCRVLPNLNSMLVAGRMCAKKQLLQIFTPQARHVNQIDEETGSQHEPLYRCTWWHFVIDWSFIRQRSCYQQQRRMILKKYIAEP